ncbi:MAG: ccmA [Rickettsiaceae bacterium]|jgi:heme exporter protein A|nr:ccmA [Rickettsiaceae bacterium]
MITLSNIECSKAGRVLFKNVGFTIGDRCALVIRGSNGAGKTSLLNIISGLAKPSAGEILYANQKVNGKHWEEYCSIINYIGHKNAIKPQLTVKENLDFWVELRGSDGRVDAAMSFFGLTPYADTPCGKLSVGWQKKVALARLLTCRSEIWLLDEPFTNLDEDTKLRLASIINTRCEQGGSVIIAMHDKVHIEHALELNLEDFAP